MINVWAHSSVSCEPMRPTVRVSSRVKMADQQAAGMASQTLFDVWGLPAPAAVSQCHAKGKEQDT